MNSDVFSFRDRRIGRGDKRSFDSARYSCAALRMTLELTLRSVEDFVALDFAHYGHQGLVDDLQVLLA
jgi:hypothetical protein